MLAAGGSCGRCALEYPPQRGYATMGPIRPTRSLITLVAALSISLALPLALPADPVDAAYAKACKVRNVTRGGSYSSLAAAVKQARNRNKLTVRGTCTGKTRITNKKLTIVGVRTSTSGTPTLKSNGKGSVLTISGDFAVVTLRNLTIRGRATQVVGYDGGGIFNMSRASLRGVTVKGFRTKGQGGGIFNLEGTLRLLGNTKIKNNKGADGSGIYNNSGTVVMGGSSAVAFNRGTGIGSDGKFSVLEMRPQSSVRNNAGTGVSSTLGKVRMFNKSRISGNRAREGAGFRGSSALTMNDRSSITGNTATEVGGGVFTDGTLTMKGSSSISGNTALQGGGVYAQSWATLVGVTCAPEASANVFGNSPDDCYLD